MEQDVGWKPVHEPVGSDIISISSFFYCHIWLRTLLIYDLFIDVLHLMFLLVPCLLDYDSKTLFLPIINHHDCCKPNHAKSPFVCHFNPHQFQLVKLMKPLFCHKNHQFVQFYWVSFVSFVKSLFYNLNP